MESDSRRAAFQKLLILVGEAMHAIELVDIGDAPLGSERKRIDEVFSFLTPDADLVRKAQAYEEFRAMIQAFLDVEEQGRNGEDG